LNYTSAGTTIYRREKKKVVKNIIPPSKRRKGGMGILAGVKKRGNVKKAQVMKQSTAEVIRNWKSYEEGSEKEKSLRKRRGSRCRTFSLGEKGGTSMLRRKGGAKITM